MYNNHKTIEKNDFYFYNEYVKKILLLHFFCPSVIQESLVNYNHVGNKNKKVTKKNWIRSLFWKVTSDVVY